MIGEELRLRGYNVDVLPTRDVQENAVYGAVILGGAVYEEHWHPDAMAFAGRYAPQLSRVPTWLFTVRSLLGGATGAQSESVLDMQAVAAQLGSVGIMTFDANREAPGAPAPEASGTYRRAGDWRDPAAVEFWVDEIDRTLQTRPNPAVS
jgi:hypothetical protein